jgi:tetratricopeptide (TPR) repeat protein
MDLEKLRLARDLFVIGTSLVIIYFTDHILGLNLFEGWGTVCIGASLVMAVLAAVVGLYFRSLLLARMLFFIGLTLVLIFVLGPEIFNRRGDIWVGASMVVLIVAVPIAAYLCRPSVRAELPVLYNLWAGNRAMIRADYARAEECFVQALTRANQLHSNRDLSLAMALSHLGSVYRGQGRLTDAESAFKEALNHYDLARPRRPVLQSNALLNLAAVFINQGRFADAEPLCRQILAQDGPASWHERRATALLNHGHILAGQGSYEAAESVTREALGLLDSQVRRGQPIGCIALCSLADFCRRQGRLTEAEPLARRALALSEKSYGLEHPTLSRFLNVLAEIVRLQGHLDEAESLCQRSQTLTEKAFGADHINLDGCLATLGRIRLAQGRDAEAEQFLRRSLSILEQVVVPEHPERIARGEEYAVVLQRLKRPGKVSPEAEG